MNFLAHLYLSGSDQDILIGNFIADSVRGKEYNEFSQGIQKGIQLHRFIDHYTDTHPVIHEAKELIAPYFGKYNSVVMDIYMDHFLAIGWNNYSDIPLFIYAQQMYQLIEARQNVLPERVQELLPYMIRQDWLTNYANFDGMTRVFRGMSKRASFESHMDEATDILQKHYAALQQTFDLFFPDLEKHTDQKRKELI